MSLFSQVNSLVYWLNNNGFIGSIIFCGDHDSYFIEIKKGNSVLYSSTIEAFAKKSEKMVGFELTAVSKVLIDIKENYDTKVKNT